MNKDTFTTLHKRAEQTMNDNNNNIVINVLLVFFMLVLLLLTTFTLINHWEFKKEAVKRGAAEWVVDDGGATTFTWKEPTR